MSRIRIRNFGPIKEGLKENEGWIDINKVTIFIGNQGSGKSTVAKVIATLSWMEKALVRGDFKEKALATNRSFSKYFRYQNIFNYFIKTNFIHEDDNIHIYQGTLIEYQGKAYHIKYDSGEVSIVKNDEYGYLFPKIMYVPAERNFVSTVDKPRTLKNLPQALYTFLDELEDAKEAIEGTLALPISDRIRFEYQKFSKIPYITGDDFKIRLSEASSGFQSFIPLYLVTRHLAYFVQNNSDNKDSSKKEISIEEEKRIRKTIDEILSNPKLTDDIKKIALEGLSAKFTYSCFINIVEEPEQNLFPSSQHQILNSLLEFNNMNEGNKLIMTTHSPYLINYLTLAVKANTLNDRIKTDSLRKKIQEIVPLTSTVKPEDLSIYELDEKDGAIKKLETYNGLPSDENELNESLGETNEQFAKLLEIQQSL
jgi:predicted ATPase